jgi:hypothetical protein
VRARTRAIFDTSAAKISEQTVAMTITELAEFGKRAAKNYLSGCPTPRVDVERRPLDRVDTTAVVTR